MKVLSFYSSFPIHVVKDSNIFSHVGRHTKFSSGFPSSSTIFITLKKVSFRVGNFDNYCARWFLMRATPAWWNGATQIVVSNWELGIYVLISRLALVDSVEEVSNIVETWLFGLLHHILVKEYLVKGIKPAQFFKFERKNMFIAQWINYIKEFCKIHFFFFQLLCSNFVMFYLNRLDYYLTSASNGAISYIRFVSV